MSELPSVLDVTFSRALNSLEYLTTDLSSGGARRTSEENVPAALDGNVYRAKKLCCRVASHLLADTSSHRQSLASRKFVLRSEADHVVDFDSSDESDVCEGSESDMQPVGRAFLSPLLASLERGDYGRGSLVRLFFESSSEDADSDSILQSERVMSTISDLIKPFEGLSTSSTSDDFLSQYFSVEEIGFLKDLVWIQKVARTSNDPGLVSGDSLVLVGIMTAFATRRASESSAESEGPSSPDRSAIFSDFLAVAYLLQAVGHVPCGVMFLDALRSAVDGLSSSSRESVLSSATESLCEFANFVQFCSDHVSQFGEGKQADQAPAVAESSGASPGSNSFSGAFACFARIAELRDYQDVLSRIYAAKNPDKVGDVPSLLEKYRSAPESLVETVCRKYFGSVSPRDALTSVDLSLGALGNTSSRVTGAMSVSVPLSGDELSALCRVSAMRVLRSDGLAGLGDHFEGLATELRHSNPEKRTAFLDSVHKLFITVDASRRSHEESSAAVPVSDHDGKVLLSLQSVLVKRSFGVDPKVCSTALSLQTRYLGFTESLLHGIRSKYGLKHQASEVRDQLKSRIDKPLERGEEQDYSVHSHGGDGGHEGGFTNTLSRSSKLMISGLLSELANSRSESDAFSKVELLVDGLMANLSGSGCLASLSLLSRLEGFAYFLTRRQLDPRVLVPLSSFPASYLDPVDRWMKLSIFGPEAHSDTVLNSLRDLALQQASALGMGSIRIFCGESEWASQSTTELWRRLACESDPCLGSLLLTPETDHLLSFDRLHSLASSLSDQLESLDGVASMPSTLSLVALSHSSNYFHVWNLSSFSELVRGQKTRDMKSTRIHPLNLVGSTASWTLESNACNDTDPNVAQQQKLEAVCGFLASLTRFDLDCVGSALVDFLGLTVSLIGVRRDHLSFMRLVYAISRLLGLTPQINSGEPHEVRRELTNVFAAVGDSPLVGGFRPRGFAWQRRVGGVSERKSDASQSEAQVDGSLDDPMSGESSAATHPLDLASLRPVESIDESVYTSISSQSYPPLSIHGSWRPLLLSRGCMRDSFMGGSLCLNCDSTSHRSSECVLPRCCWNCHANPQHMLVLESGAFTTLCPFPCRFCGRVHTEANVTFVDCMKKSARRFAEWRRSKLFADQVIIGPQLLWPSGHAKVSTSNYDRMTPASESMNQGLGSRDAVPGTSGVLGRIPDSAAPRWVEVVFLDDFVSEALVSRDVVRLFMLHFGNQLRQKESSTGGKVGFGALGFGWTASWAHCKKAVEQQVQSVLTESDASSPHLGLYSHALPVDSRLRLHALIGAPTPFGALALRKFVVGSLKQLNEMPLAMQHVGDAMAPVEYVRLSARIESDRAASSRKTGRQSSAELDAPALVQYSTTYSNGRFNSALELDLGDERVEELASVRQMYSGVGVSATIDARMTSVTIPSSVAQIAPQVAELTGASQRTVVHGFLSLMSNWTYPPPACASMVGTYWFGRSDLICIDAFSPLKSAGLTRGNHGRGEDAARHEGMLEIGSIVKLSASARLFFKDAVLSECHEATYEESSHVSEPVVESALGLLHGQVASIVSPELLLAHLKYPALLSVSSDSVSEEDAFDIKSKCIRVLASEFASIEESDVSKSDFQSWVAKQLGALGFYGANTTGILVDWSFGIPKSTTRARHSEPPAVVEVHEIPDESKGDDVALQNGGSAKPDESANGVFEDLYNLSAIDLDILDNEGVVSQGADAQFVPQTEDSLKPNFSRLCFFVPDDAQLRAWSGLKKTIEGINGTHLQMIANRIGHDAQVSLQENAEDSSLFVEVTAEEGHIHSIAEAARSLVLNLLSTTFELASDVVCPPGVEPGEYAQKLLDSVRVVQY